MKTQRIKSTIVTDFERMQAELLNVLDLYGIKQNFVYNQLGMTRQTWTKKNKQQLFTVHEMKQICDILNN